MANGIRTGDPDGLKKGRSSKFRGGSRVQQTLKEGQGIYQPKRCENNNKDEGSSPKTLNDKNIVITINFSSYKLFSNKFISIFMAAFKN